MGNCVWSVKRFEVSVVFVRNCCAWVWVPSIAALLLGRSGIFAASRILPGQTAQRYRCEGESLLWLLITAAVALLLAVAGATQQTWLAILLWPLLLAASGMALVDNAHVVLIETGLMESLSCSPFPFYSDYLPLHEYWPDVFMSGGVCGQNDYFIFGLPFTVWTLASIAALCLLVLFTLWRSIRR